MEANVKLKCVSRFIFLGDTLGEGWGVEEAARAIERDVPRPSSRSWQTVVHPFI